MVAISLTPSPFLMISSPGVDSNLQKDQKFQNFSRKIFAMGFVPQNLVANYYD